MDKGKNIAIESLIKTLKNSEILPDNLINPFTKAEFLNGDESGKIIYTLDEKKGKYQLDIFGFKNEVILLSIKNS